MDIVKKNIVSIICGVVALLAVIAVAWPIGGMYADATKQLDERKKVYDRVDALRKKPRAWPAIDWESSTQEPLKRFPNDVIIKEGERVRGAVHEQAEQVVQDTVRDNRHEPLVPGILPNPGDRRFEFQRAYLAQIQGPQAAVPPGQFVPNGFAPLAAGATGLPPASRDQGLIAKSLEAVLPPDDAEVTAESLRIWKEKYDPKLININNQFVNLQAVTTDWQAECDKLAEKLSSERAEKYRMYIDAGALVPSPEMLTPGQAPSVENIWYAQNMLWVQQDVTRAIKEINKSAKNVKDSPVKQLVRLEIPAGPAQYVTSTPIAGGAMPAAAPVSGAPDAPIGKAYDRTPTGRVSNNLYDVVGFTLVINVDARQIPMILAELQRGRLITIYQADTTVVDSQAAYEESGYVYGPAPVVTLTLKGEELFLRDWTLKLMPESVKTALGIVPVDPAAAAAGTPGR